MNKIPFEDWEKATSQFLPPGPVVHLHGDDVEYTLFGEGEREEEGCVIGNFMDVAFDDDGKSRSDDEIMILIDGVVFDECETEIEYYDYILDDALVAAFSETIGLTKEEYIKKKNSED